jgi:hypothetical protein
MLYSSQPSRLPLAIAIGTMLVLTACGGADHNNNADTVPVISAAPADQGAPDTAPVPSVPAFVDTAATNQRGDARYATLATNAGVRVLGGMLDIWKPLTEIVDAGVTAPAVDGFPAVPMAAPSSTRPFTTLISTTWSKPPPIAPPNRLCRLTWTIAATRVTA